MFSTIEIKQITNKGLSIAQIHEQLNRFEIGFSPPSLIASASTKKGIKVIKKKDQQTYVDTWFSYLKQDKKIVKFVPASGAATRMFKDLSEFLFSTKIFPTTDFEKKFFSNIHRFAFYSILNKQCINSENKSVDELIISSQYKKIVENLLTKQNLNYRQLPKGLIPFYLNSNTCRTAMEEHLVEGVFYAKNKFKQVNIQFTVSSKHRSSFEFIFKEKKNFYSRLFDVKYLVTFSEQKISTDTLTVDLENQPFREKNKLVFHQGGHGALIENLNDLSADIVFIKNIDNVVPDFFKVLTGRYKQLLAGILVTYQKQIFRYLNLIDSGKCTHDQIVKLIYFIENELCIENPEIEHLGYEDLIIYLKSKLNRPLRVCGMVRNEGKLGGAPFFVENKDRTISLQIIESSQIDFKDSKKKYIFESGTHFNPVDLVCALKNYKGEKFNLFNYVDKDAGFISMKFKNGKKTKVLELPGLWNGAMSDWITLLIEVPTETFNPVKTVNDLLLVKY